VKNSKILHRLFSPEAADHRTEHNDREEARYRKNADGTEAWGYVDVRPGAHMFYWLYHSYHPDGYLTRPLIIWLEVRNTDWNFFAACGRDTH
jgi:hypothetical protein